MPETPKSFEEYWQAATGGFQIRSTKNFAEETWNAALASLTPQTAPGPETDDFNEAGIRAARPDVSEGGEGELTVVTGSTAEDVNIDFYYAGAVDEHIRRLKTERDLAIAQRDEARKDAKSWKRAAEDSAEVRLAVSEGALHARQGKPMNPSYSVSGRLNFHYQAAYEDVRNRIDTEAKLAAAADFKPGELERYDYNIETSGMVKAKYGDYVAFEDVLARLRSLPSEPQDENRKAAENVR